MRSIVKNLLWLWTPTHSGPQFGTDAASLVKGFQRLNETMLGKHTAQCLARNRYSVSSGFNRISFESLQILKCYSNNSLSVSREVHKSIFMGYVVELNIRKGSGKEENLI